MYPPLTKLRQSAHYHRVASSIFVEHDSVCRVKQAKWARSRFRLCLFVRFLSKRRRLTRALAREHLSSFRSVPPPPDSSGWGRPCCRVGLVSVYLFERSKNYRTRVAGRRCLPFDHRATTRNFAYPCHLTSRCASTSRFRKFVHQRQNCKLSSYSKTKQTKSIYCTHLGEREIFSKQAKLY